MWKWGDQAPGGRARQNHDWTRLANGNTLLVVARPAVVPELAAHEKQLLARLGELVAVQEPEIRELLPLVAGHAAEQ